MSNFKKTHIPKFRRFVIQNFPFIEQDFDALTDYALICKVVEYLNAVIASTNESSAQVEELTNLYNQLKSYVDNYFDNLDVQDEINNKLDAFAQDGTLYRLINDEIFGDINDRILAHSQEITALQDDQSNNVKKDEANSVTMEMLTQSVREALTGGSTAVVGVNSVSGDNIQNGAVSFTKLDSLIAANLELEYTSLESSLSYSTGFYYPVGYVVGGDLKFSSADSSTECASIDLVKGKTYRFTGTSYSSTFGLVIGTAVDSPVLAVCPKDGKLNKSFYTAPANDQQGSDFVFTVFQTGLKAFITRNKPTSNAGIAQNILSDTRGLYEVTKITTLDQNLVLNSYETLTPDFVHESKFLDASGDNSTKNPYRLYDVNDARYKVSIYRLRRGHTYKVEGTQIYGNPGFELFNGANILQYISLESATQTQQSYSYEFKATSDGFCAISTCPSTYTGVLYEKVHVEDDSISRLAGKRIAYNGDSITESRLNTSSVSYNAGAYPKLIADLTNSAYSNFAVGGGTLAYRNASGHRICRDIVNMNGNYDAIIFSGGINDYWQNIPLGTYSESDYTSDVNDTTVCGALESIFRQAINKWCGKPIMFVITHKIYHTVYNNNTAGYSFKDLHDAIVGICDKYSIPYYDCYKDGGLNSYIPIMNTTYMTAGASGQPDYTHPNEEAYKRYYVPQVISMIEGNLKY